MRFLLTIIASLVALTAFGAGSDTGTTVGTNVIYTVLPPKQMAVGLLTVDHTQNGSTFDIYDTEVATRITAALAAGVGSNITATLTAGDYEPGDSVLIYDVSGASYERLWVERTNGVAGIVVTNTSVAPGQDADEIQSTLAEGDIVYKLTKRFSEGIAANGVISRNNIWKAKGLGPSIIETIAATGVVTNRYLGLHYGNR